MTGLPSLSILRVPGSSANLGPGFDALGIALQVYLECRFAPPDRLTIRVRGRDAELISPREDNLIWQTALAIAARAHKPLPLINLEIINDIPIGKGVGSSAAALTAGVVIAERLLELGWNQSRILDEAARLEGHPDNVAACVMGSIVASAVEPGGLTRAVRLEMPHQFRSGGRHPELRLAHQRIARRAARLLLESGHHLQRAARRPADRGACDGRRFRLPHRSR